MPDAATIKTLVTVVAALVSAGFGIVAWLAKREVARKDREIEDLQEDVSSLMKLVPVMESFEKRQDAEIAERKRIEEQQWSKINSALGAVLDLRTTLSEHQGLCQTKFMTQAEFARLEGLRERMERQKALQDERLNQNVLQLLTMLQSAPRSGRT